MSNSINDDHDLEPMQIEEGLPYEEFMASSFAIPESRDGMEYLVNIGSQIEKANETPYICEIEGETYVFYGGDVKRYTPFDEPAPEIFRVFSLKGLVEWIKADVNAYFCDGEEPCIVHVINPTRVVVETPCEGYNNRSKILASCEYSAPDVPYDRFMDAEEFGIMLQTLFMMDAARDLVLSVVRNMTQEQSVETADDGVSQRVTVRQGITNTDKTIFKNPAILCPLRTFPEVEQPASPFILRFKEGPRAALWEADAGKWRVDAVRLIGEYLKDALSGTNLVVIA